MQAQKENRASCSRHHSRSAISRAWQVGSNKLMVTQSQELLYRTKGFLDWLRGDSLLQKRAVRLNGCGPPSKTKKKKTEFNGMFRSCKQSQGKVETVMVMMYGRDGDRDGDGLWVPRQDEKVNGLVGVCVHASLRVCGCECACACVCAWFPKREKREPGLGK